MPQYRKFAEVYDQMKADRHSRLMVDYTMDIIRKFKIDVRTGLDLCCGTGTAIKLFTAHGFEMSGLDASKDMLAVARKKLEGKNVRLYRQTLPKFEIRKGGKSKQLQRFDLITSYFDALNYLLTARDLKTCFRGVFRHLENGGWFIFDMNTPKALTTLWDENVHADVTPDLAWVWKNEFYPKTKKAACYATFFRRRGSMWERFDEVHWEAAYPNSEIRKMLREVGFTIKGFYHCRTFDRPTKETTRICVVARRPL